MDIRKNFKFVFHTLMAISFATLIFIPKIGTSTCLITYNIARTIILVLERSFSAVSLIWNQYEAGNYKNIFF